MQGRTFILILLLKLQYICITIAIEATTHLHHQLGIRPEYFKIGEKNIKYAKMCHELDNVNNINVKGGGDISNVYSFDFWGNPELHNTGTEVLGEVSFSSKSCPVISAVFGREGAPIS